jgi:hypothetical protein
MNVLLSWSKEQSKAVVLIFREWLPNVLPGIEPWISSKDISKGREWFRELHGVLEETQVCIIFLTAENVRSPWLYYEAGAIATNGPDVTICPYLLGLSPNILADGPLGQRQCTVATQDDTWELIKSLNADALNSKHDLSLLQGNFKLRWSDFEEKLQPILQVEPEAPEGFIATDADQLAGAKLSSEARTMVLEVSKDKNGLLSFSRTSSGTGFSTNGLSLCPDQSPRTIAKWEAALKDLRTYNVLEARGHKGETFALTALGFEIADLLVDSHN